jgi:hypothetical protein
MRVRGLMIAMCVSAGSASALDTPPLELLDANVADAPYTVDVRVDAVSTAQVIRDSHGDPGYVTFHVSATVLESIRGDLSGSITFSQTMEAPGHAPRIGDALVVSLVKRDGTLLLPDMNGYVFPATPSVLERARKASRASAKP